MLLMITLVILLIKLTTLIYQDVLVIIAKDMQHLKKLLINVVIQKGAVVLLGVVGVLPKETTWSTSVINSDKDRKLYHNQHQKKYLGF